MALIAQMASPLLEVARVLVRFNHVAWSKRSRRSSNMDRIVKITIRCSPSDLKSLDLEVVKARVNSETARAATALWSRVCPERYSLPVRLVLPFPCLDCRWRP